MGELVGGLTDAEAAVEVVLAPVLRRRRSSAPPGAGRARPPARSPAPISSVIPAANPIEAKSARRRGALVGLDRDRGDQDAGATRRCRPAAAPATEADDRAASILELTPRACSGKASGGLVAHRTSPSPGARAARPPAKTHTWASGAALVRRPRAGGSCPAFTVIASAAACARAVDQLRGVMVERRSAARG